MNISLRVTHLARIQLIIGSYRYTERTGIGSDRNYLHIDRLRSVQYDI